MGLDINSVKLLMMASARGMRLDNTLTIGRQDMNVYPQTLRKLIPHYVDGYKGFADGLFYALGAKSVSALDCSDFEGAEIVHDLNLPLTPQKRYDLVFDGGTLEHVFNFPTALKNCMDLVKEGGSLIIHTPINNWCGHGFYQLSPALFYAALSEANGFEVVRMIVHRTGPYNRWHEVQNPKLARVELMSVLPMQLMVWARRKEVVPIFERFPQQSDYEPRWTMAGTSWSGTRPWLSKALPGLARLLNVGINGFRFLKNHSLRNRKAFRPL